MTQEDIQELRETISRDKKTVEAHQRFRDYKNGKTDRFPTEMIDVNSIGHVLGARLLDLEMCLGHIEKLQEKLRVTEEELDITLRNNCYREN